VPPVDHEFADPSLLTEALTHASWSHEHGGRDNERLEFLGDAVLQLCVTRALVASFPRGG
jgi:ribonuclease-3